MTQVICVLSLRYDSLKLYFQSPFCTRYLIISYRTHAKKLCLYEQIFLVLSNDAPKIGYNLTFFTFVVNTYTGSALKMIIYCYTMSSGDTGLLKLNGKPKHN